MKPFESRRPAFKSLLFGGALLGALVIYALSTGTMITPPSNSHPAQAIRRAEHPHEFWFAVRFFAVCSVGLCAIALVRVPPVEDRWRVWKAALRRKADESGATTKPAPLWAYLLLVGFVGFIGYLVYSFMYRD